jgi:hypothetical protein
MIWAWEPMSGFEPLTCRLQGRFTQGVNLRVPRSEAVRYVCGWPLVTAVFCPFWHGCGTGAPARLPRKRQVSRPLCGMGTVAFVKHWLLHFAAGYRDNTGSR